MTKSYSEYKSDIEALEKKLAAVRKSAENQKKKEDAEAAKKLAESKARETKAIEQKRCFAERALFDYFVAIGLPDNKETMDTVHDTLIACENTSKRYDKIKESINKRDFKDFDDLYDWLFSL